MPLYSYRCPECLDFDVSLAMGEANNSYPCPACGASSPRRFTAPHLSRASGSAYRLIAGAERSAAEPAVVGLPGPGRGPAPAGVSANPLHRGLPRPD